MDNQIAVMSECAWCDELLDSDPLLIDIHNSMRHPVLHRRYLLMREGRLREKKPRVENAVSQTINLESNELQQAQKHQCDQCGKQFSSLIAVKIHRGRAHKRAPGKLAKSVRPMSDELKRQCDECGKWLRTAAGVKVHKLRAHGMRSYTDLETGAQLQRHQKRNQVGTATASGTSGTGKNKRRHACAQCGKNYKFRSWMLVHMRTHAARAVGGRGGSAEAFCSSNLSTDKWPSGSGVGSDNSAHVCMLCGSGFTTPDTLFIHSRKCAVATLKEKSPKAATANGKAPGKPRSAQATSCPHCARHFSSQRRYVKHRQLRCIECKLCGVTVDFRWQMDTHIEESHGDDGQCGGGGDFFEFPVILLSNIGEVS